MIRSLVLLLLFSTEVLAQHVESVAAALSARTVARVIDQYAPHQLRRDPKKVRAVFPVNLFLIDQPEISLVYQRRGLQRVARALTSHVVMGQPMQLTIDQGQQSVERRPVTITPGDKQLSHFLWRGCRHIHTI